MSTTESPLNNDSGPMLEPCGSVGYWPATAADVRDFVGSDYCAMLYGRQDQVPDDGDIYTMSAHDIISAILTWQREVLGQDA